MPFNYEAAISGLEVKHAKDVFDGINLSQLQIPNNEIVKYATIAISAGVLADLMQLYIQPTQNCCYGWMYLRRHNIHYAKDIHGKAIEVKNAIVEPMKYGSNVNLERLTGRVNRVLQEINQPFDRTKNPAGVNPVGDFAMALTVFLNKYWNIKYPVAYGPPLPGQASSGGSSKRRFDSFRRLLPNRLQQDSASRNSVQLTETSELLSGQAASPPLAQSYTNLHELEQMIEFCSSIALAESIQGIMPNVGDNVWSASGPDGARILSLQVISILNVGRC